MRSLCPLPELFPDFFNNVEGREDNQRSGADHQATQKWFFMATRDEDGEAKADNAHELIKKLVPVKPALKNMNVGKEGEIERDQEQREQYVQAHMIALFLMKGAKDT